MTLHGHGDRHGLYTDCLLYTSTTEGNHISITNYTIASVVWNETIIEDPDTYFTVSETGEISIIKGNQNIQPGKYILSFKLTTAATGEDPEMGIFENALEIHVTSRPLSLTYTPNEGKIEEEGELSPETTFQSNPPVLKGSTEGLSLIHIFIIH